MRAGLFAQGTLTLERVEHALIVPATALREAGGQRFVYVLDDGVLRKRSVTAEAADASGRVRILSGLQPGTRIVRNDLGALRDGTAARVTAPRPAN